MYTHTDRGIYSRGKRRLVIKLTPKKMRQNRKYFYHAVCTAVCTIMDILD